VLAVLRRRDFCLFWFGGVLSVIGDFFLFIALPFFVYERTGSVLATGAMFVAETLPRLLFGSVAGVFVDRWDRKRTMILADLSRALILLPLFAVAAGGPLWLVYAVAFSESTASQFFLPAKSALVPRLVPERDLTAANSLNSVGEDVPSLVGPLLGGALLGLIGLGGLIFLDIDRRPVRRPGRPGGRGRRRGRPADGLGLGRRGAGVAGRAAGTHRWEIVAAAFPGVLPPTLF